MLRRLYDWTLAKAAHPHASWWLAAIAFIESSFFPIPPHPLLGLMCLAEPRKAIRFGLITTIASVLGGLFGYAIGYFLYASVGATIIDFLGLGESFPKAACYLREYDVEVILVAGATPVPFKLLTITAGFIEMALIPFTLAALVGRGVTFLSVGILFQLFGAPIKAIIDKHLGKLTALFVVLVVGGFLALSVLGGGASESNEKCEQAGSIEVPRAGL
jgi:membrane protein YqaA with SNARE-associated domain